MNQNTSFIEFNDMNQQQFNINNNNELKQAFVYHDHVNLGYISSSTSTSTSTAAPDQDNGSSCCTSPNSSILVNNLFHTSPSLSPYQPNASSTDIILNREFYQPDFLSYPIADELFDQGEDRQLNETFIQQVNTSGLSITTTNEPRTPLPITKTTKVVNSELRRQIHIQSEQKRRAQIKDGFEDLRNELPSCLNKKMSKVALLHRTVQHIQHLKNTQMTILAELERLASENEQLRKFQDNILQKQPEKMYSSL